MTKTRSHWSKHQRDINMSNKHRAAAKKADDTRSPLAKDTKGPAIFGTEPRRDHLEQIPSHLDQIATTICFNIKFLEQVG